MKKFLSVVLTLIIALTIFTGCGKKEEPVVPTAEVPTEVAEVPTETPAEPEVEEVVLKVAAIETAYGSEMWTDVAKAFEEAKPGVKVELTLDKKLEDAIRPSMTAGEYPDVVHLAVGREAALTETLIKEKVILDITDVLSMPVLGESITVGKKIIPGFTDTLTTNPYNDGKTYLAPMFYSPCGLFYDANLLKTKGWELPTTWDGMWELGDKAKAEGIALFTYPTTGYFDAFFYALLNVTGGPALFNDAMLYTEGVWDRPEATAAFDIVAKLASYTESTTPANANGENFLKNQQLVLDDGAIFMPNGTWITGEMAEAPRVDGFEWGFTALPSEKAGGDAYSYTFFEQAWIPAEAKNIDLAKEFVSFLYSDIAVDIFAKSGAIQPVVGVADKLEGENKLFYSIYEGGAKASLGGFAATAPVEGVNMADVLFGTVDSLVTGDKTEADWIASVKEASDKLRAALE